jgi:hypothetical protein
MVNSKSSCDILASAVDRTIREYERNEIRSEKKDSKLPDNSVSLWGWGGELFRWVEEEVEGCWRFNEYMYPKGKSG